jgi:2-aminoadipate transaminase
MGNIHAKPDRAAPSALRLSRRAQWAETPPISELMSRALAEPDLISLAAGFVDQQSLPVQAVRQVMTTLLDDPQWARASLQYGTTAGFPPLREAIRQQLLVRDACCHPLSLDQIVITAGSNQLLHLVCESLLDPGDIVLCAAPTYLVFLGTLGNLGARSMGVAVDDYGMIPDALELTLKRLQRRGESGRVKAIYLVPYFDNPCGLTMPLERRARIVELAQRWSQGHRIHVIADEAYRDLRYTGDDVAGTLTVDDHGETVIVTGTFSKSFSPGLRVGWGILPRHLVGPVCGQKGNIDFGSPNFCQHVMAQVLNLGLFESHVARLCRDYREKLRVMLTALRRHLGSVAGVRWNEPRGGLYVWVTLPPGVDAGPAGALFEAARHEGVLYVPGEYCYPPAGEPVRNNVLRLSFGVQTPEKIEQGVAALARAICRLPACPVAHGTP